MAERLPEHQTRDDFPALFRSFRERARRTGHALAQQVKVDASYLSRIEGGTREPPRAPVVTAICDALVLSLPDRNRLLLAAGYAPTSLVELGYWDATFQATADVLNDRRLSADEREAFRSAVLLMAENWGDRNRRSRSLRAVDPIEPRGDDPSGDDDHDPMPLPH